MIAPRIPVWEGFGPSRFSPAVDPSTGRAYTYAKDGVEATRYDLATDQLGTQLDPQAWLMHHGYTQAEGVAHLDRVPATGCLVSAGFPRFRGGTGGYASYTAICPPGWRHGARISAADAPLARIAQRLRWSPRAGARVR